MKKKWIVVLSIFIVILVICLAICLFRKNSPILDYTNLAENELYASNLSLEELLFDGYYDIENPYLKNYLYIRCVDEEKNPIPEAEVTFYNEEGYAILTKKANTQGEVALANLENNKTYDLKQTKTREGLIRDTTLYTFTTDKGLANQGTVFFISTKQEIEKEKRQEMAKNYRQEYLSEFSNQAKIVESEQEKENRRQNNRIAQFLFIHKELKDLKLEFVYTEEKLEVGEEKLRGRTLRIPGAQILEYTVETEDTNIQFLDKERKKTNQFKDASPYYIQVPEGYSGGVKYHFTITFRFNGKTYRVGKDLNQKITSSQKGKLEVRFYDIDTKKPQKEIRTCLYLLNNVTKEKVPLLLTLSSSEGRVRIKNLTFGTYVVSKEGKDGEEVFSEEIIIKGEEQVEVEF